MKLLKIISISFFIFFYSCKNSSKPNINPSTSEFNYTHTKPKNGTLKGVVELGTSGFNYFIIDADLNKNWELKKAHFGKSLISEGMTTPEQIIQNLTKKIEQIVAYGVAKKNIYTVISSGAIKDELTQSIVNELEKLNHSFEIVSIKEEGVYGAKAILPQEFYKNSFVVDIGSGNTKISYTINNNDFKTIETFGSKYHQIGSNDEEVFKKVKESVALIPQEKKKYCFIMGGVPHKLASFLQKKKERHTQLSIKEEDYSELVKQKGRMISSGVNIYKSILEETDCKIVLFDWHANFAIGYLLEKETTDKN